MRTTGTIGTTWTSGTNVQALTYKGVNTIDCVLTLTFRGAHCTPHPKCENAPFSERRVLTCSEHVWARCPYCPSKISGVAG